MTVRNISIQVYRQIELEGLLSKRRWTVYNALYKYGPCTANELYHHMLKDGSVNTRNQQANLTPRLGELRELGCVYEHSETLCPITGRMVIVWEVTTRLPGTLEKRESRYKRQNRRIRELESLVVELRDQLSKWGRPKGQAVKAKQQSLFDL